LLVEAEPLGYAAASSRPATASLARILEMWKLAALG
jgi:hypothetical protein